MNLRNPFYLIGFGVIVILIAWVSMSTKINRLQKENSLQAVELMSFKDSATVLRTKTGQLYSQIENVTIEKNALRGSLDAIGIERSELRKMGIKWRDLAALYKAKLEASDSGSTIAHDTVYIAGKDTIWGKKFNDWSNKYLTLTKLYSDNKKLFFTYNYQTDINYSQEKDGKDVKITLWLSDPKATVVTGSQITINQDPIKWYQKWWLWGSAGLITGYLITK
jgi:hypothetical protein